MFVVLYENLSTLFAFCAITYLFLEERRAMIKRKEKDLLSTFFIDSEGQVPFAYVPVRCNALFIYLIILLENIVYYYILYDFW